MLNIYGFVMFGRSYKGIKGQNLKKINFLENALSIHQSMCLDVLITNIYGFNVFGLNLDEILVVKGSKNRKNQV